MCRHYCPQIITIGVYNLHILNSQNNHEYTNECHGLKCKNDSSYFEDIHPLLLFFISDFIRSYSSKIKLLKSITVCCLHL